MAVDDQSQIGFGAKMAINDGASHAYVDVKQTVTLTLPKQEFGEYEEKKLSTASKIRVFRPTLQDPGDVTNECYYDKLTHTRLLALLGVEGTMFKCYSPDDDGAGADTGELLTITGWVKSIGEVKFEKDKETMLTWVVRPTAITYADATNNFPVAS